MDLSRKMETAESRINEYEDELKSVSTQIKAKIAEQEASEVNGFIQAINTNRGSQFYPKKPESISGCSFMFLDGKIKFG